MINLLEAVRNGQKLEKGMNVFLPMNLEGLIFGFIPSYNDCYLPPLGLAEIIGQRAVHRYMRKDIMDVDAFPIFDTICKADEEKYDIKFLNLLRVREYQGSTRYDAYLTAASKGMFYSGLYRIPYLKIEDKECSYSPEKGDLYFQGPTLRRAIGNGFAVVTYRIIKDKEVFAYEVFSPYDVKLATE